MLLVVVTFSNKCTAQSFISLNNVGLYLVDDNLKQICTRIARVKND